MDYPDQILSIITRPYQVQAYSFFCCAVTILRSKASCNMPNIRKTGLFNSTHFGPLNAYLRHFPKDFQKKKSTLLTYFFMLYVNLV